MCRTRLLASKNRFKSKTILTVAKRPSVSVGKFDDVPSTLSYILPVPSPLNVRLMAILAMYVLLQVIGVSGTAGVHAVIPVVGAIVLVRGNVRDRVNAFLETVSSLKTATARFAVHRQWNCCS